MFRFRKKDEKGGWGFDIMCMRRPGVRGICANAPLCAALIPSVARARGFSSRRGVVQNLLIYINLHIYQLLQSTPFEMQLGALPGLYRLLRYVQPQRLWGFFNTFSSDRDYDMSFAFVLN